MLGWLLLAFTAIPLLETYLLIEIGSRIGAFPTLAGVVVTGVIGASLARAQGISAARELQRATGSGRIPGDELVGAVLVLVGGVLLVTPGVMTDLVGLSLMVPAVRRAVGRRVLRSLRSRLQITMTGMGGVPPPEGPATGQTVDVSATREDD